MDNAGKPYGVKEILGLACVLVYAKLGFKVNNPFKEAGTTWICNQLVAGILDSCDGIDLPTDINDMTPIDTYNLVQSLPKKLS